MTDPDYRKLPEPVSLDDTVPTVDTRQVQDPEGERNKDQHRALRDD